MISRNVLRKIIFYGVVFFTYAFVIIWLCKHIWGEPATSFEKYVHMYEKELIEIENDKDCKYSIAGAYKTVNQHCIYQFTGWQAQKNQGVWENTLQSILLEGKDCTYSVDIIVEELEYAPRIIGSNLKNEKYAYRAIFPTKEMETGLYRVGMLLEDDEVVWTDESFYVGIYSEKTESGNILINDANLLFDKETNIWEGRGDNVCFNVEQRGDNKELRISYDAKAGFEDTYLVFYANDITIRIDLSQEMQSYECTLPLQNGTNEVWIYCIVDGDTSLEEGKNYYYFKNLIFEIADKEK